MPGIVNEAVAEKPAQSQQQPAQPQKRVLSPESQRIVIAAKKVMAQPEVAQQLIAMMKSAADPATGIAQATIFLVKQLYEKSKGTMPPKAIAPAAQEILVDIVRLGVSAKIFEFSADLVKQAAMMAIKMFKDSLPKQQPPAQPAAQPAAPAPMPPAEPVMGA